MYCDSILSKYPELRRCEKIKSFVQNLELCQSCLEECVIETALPNSPESADVDFSEDPPYTIKMIDGKKPLPEEALKVLEKVYKQLPHLPYRMMDSKVRGWVKFDGDPNIDNVERRRIRVDAGRKPQVLVTYLGYDYYIGWSDGGGSGPHLWCKKGNDPNNYRYFFVGCNSQCNKWGKRHNKIRNKKA